MRAKFYFILIFNFIFDVYIFGGLGWPHCATFVFSIGRQLVPPMRKDQNLAEVCFDTVLTCVFLSFRFGASSNAWSCATHTRAACMHA